jgi:hypothetical protein
MIQDVRGHTLRPCPPEALQPHRDDVRGAGFGLRDFVAPTFGAFNAPAVAAVRQFNPAIVQVTRRFGLRPRQDVEPLEIGR